MKRFVLLLAAVSLAVSANSEPLVCPDQPPAGSCVRFHYHVEVWNPASNAVEELTGLNQFATIDECSNARTSESRRNIAAIDSLLTADAKSNAQPDRYGPCHCDMTIAPSNPLYLSDSARQAQLQRYRETTGHLRDALIAAGVPPTSEIAAALVLPPAGPASTVVPPTAGSTLPAAQKTDPASALPKPDSKIEIHWSKERGAPPATEPGSGDPSQPASTAPSATTDTQSGAAQPATGSTPPSENRQPATTLAGTAPPANSACRGTAGRSRRHGGDGHPVSGNDRSRRRGT
jgi:hypothetical protein